MRVRLGDAMKLIAILAIGLGVGEWTRRERLAIVRAGRAGVESGNGSLKRRLFDVREQGVPILVGLTVATGALVLAERARRKPQKPWGVGRWSATAGLLVLLQFLLLAVLAEMNVNRGAATAREALSSALLLMAIGGVNWDRSMALLACFVSAKLAGWKGDPVPDAIEWFGRFLFVATCVVPIGYQLATCFLPP